MMSSRRGVVAFDVLGTCFGLEALVDALRAEFGDALRDPVQTALLWYYSAQRDFVYMHAMGDYVRQSSSTQLTRTGTDWTSLQGDPRADGRDGLRECQAAAESTGRPGRARPHLGQAQPDDAATGADRRCADDRAARLITPAYNKLEQAGFEVWAVTNGGTENTLKLFTAASEANAQQLSLPIKDRILSCDKIQVAKPDARVVCRIEIAALTDAVREPEQARSRHVIRAPLLRRSPLVGPPRRG